MNIFTKHLKIRLKIFVNLGTKSSNLRWYRVPEKHYYRIFIWLHVCYFLYWSKIKRTYLDLFLKNNLIISQNIKAYLFLYNNNMVGFFSLKKNIKNILLYKSSLYFFFKTKSFSNIFINSFTFFDFIIWLHCSNIDALFLINKNNNLILNSFLSKLSIHRYYCLISSFYYISDQFDICLCEILTLYLKNKNYFMQKFTYIK